jgi:hypothetical protein
MLSALFPATIGVNAVLIQHSMDASPFVGAAKDSTAYVSVVRLHKNKSRPELFALRRAALYPPQLAVIFYRFLAGSFSVSHRICVVHILS